MSKPDPFKYFQSSPEIIRLAVMLYVGFPLSLRNVEEGKNVVRAMSFINAQKLHKNAEKKQSAFEKKLQKECDSLMKQCKGDKDQEKIAEEFIKAVGKAARGHGI